MRWFFPLLLLFAVTAQAAGPGKAAIASALSACNGLILRLLHFGRSDKFHRLGDLSGVFDRLNTPANVSEVGHGSGVRCQEGSVRGNYFQDALKSSTAVLREALRSSLRAFSSAIA